MRDDPVGRWIQSRREAICGLYEIRIGQTYVPRMDTLWTGLAHPLVLAILEHRAPGGGWIGDPFGDPETKLSFPTISWKDGFLHSSALAMPLGHGDHGGQHGNGPDSGNWDEVAYIMDSSSEIETVVYVPGILPDTIISSLPGMALHQVIELPPIQDGEIARSCRDLRIESVTCGFESTAMKLKPTLWLACAPVPDDLPFEIDRDFLSIDVVI